MAYRRKTRSPRRKARRTSSFTRSRARRTGRTRRASSFGPQRAQTIRIVLEQPAPALPTSLVNPHGLIPATVKKSRF